MDLVDEQDRAGLLVQLPEQALQTLFEIAAILGARQQRTQVEGVDGAVFEHVRYIAVDDHLGESFGDRRLADTGLAHIERVVLTPPAENLHGPLHLVAPTDQRIDLAEQCLLVEIDRIGFQR